MKISPPLSFKPKSHKKLDSNEDVPMLKFRTNTYYTVIEEISYTVCVEKYGNLEKLINSDDY